jgi:hypothetical protein
MFRIRLRIRFPYWVTSRVVLASVLLPAIFLAALTVNRVRATATDPADASATTLGVRQFYLSKSVVTAAGARSACAEGYHFASIWEIADPSALKYNTSLGQTGTDSGAGPPTMTGVRDPITARGWVRTGFSYSTTGIPGQANCGTWLISDGMYWGTTANLPSDWTGGEQDIGVWNVDVQTCNESRRVWCVQDDSMMRVYLPIIIQ